MGGAAAIPLTEILAYCQLYGITDQEEISDLVYSISAIDAAWLKSINASKET